MSDDLSRGQSLSSGGLRTNARTHRASSDVSSRDDIAGMLTGAINQPRLWDAVNYPRQNELHWEAFWTRYEQTSQGFGIVEKFANDTWQSLPDITDDHDADDGTDFDEQVESLFEQQGIRRGPAHWINTADKMSTLGRYAVLVIGVNDGKDPSEPIAGHDSEDRPFDGLDDLNYLAAYTEDDVVDFDTEDDVRDERFGLPVEYDIRIDTDNDGGEDTTETFHHSRVIHIAQNVFDNPLKGIPFLKPVFHDLLNVDKILAASAEGYWRGAYHGLVVKPPTNGDGVPLQYAGGNFNTDALQNSSDLVDQIEDYTQNFQRTITTTGDIEQLNTSIESPKDHLEAQYRSISHALDAPMSVLMGNETGERATQEDRAMWQERIHNRRKNFAEPIILRPFLDQLINIGILPETQGETYNVEWQPLEEPSDAELADMRHVIAQAIDLMSGGRPTSMFTRPELRKILDYDPEIGSEVDESVDQSADMPPDPEDALPPEEAPDEPPQDDEPPPDEPDERMNTFTDESKINRSETEGEAKWHSEDEPAA